MSLCGFAVSDSLNVMRGSRGCLDRWVGREGTGGPEELAGFQFVSNVQFVDKNCDGKNGAKVQLYSGSSLAQTVTGPDSGRGR